MGRTHGSQTGRLERWDGMGVAYGGSGKGRRETCLGRADPITLRPYTFAWVEYKHVRYLIYVNCSNSSYHISHSVSVVRVMSNASTSIRTGDMSEREKNECTEACHVPEEFQIYTDPMSQGKEKSERTIY